ncbi:excalibur calcium-binding domain-containing protein [Neisseria sp. Marseille-Q5346]|uniref:excalibur calcium-binding domain-containing protein n=1 Tax=Neisseria sp. Marseille-Q5346 TaxID=2972775 RepID=UPI0021DFC78B|nr:excalibur calcium-binding domain-containing protein [Neisseria sp. Marseille-Q5346]
MKKSYLSALLPALLLLTPSVAMAKSCKDFPTHQVAQKYFQAKKPGWKQLDRDGDGRACDCNPGGQGKKCPKKGKK